MTIKDFHRCQTCRKKTPDTASSCRPSLWPSDASTCPNLVPPILFTPRRRPTTYKHLSLIDTRQQAETQQATIPLCHLVRNPREKDETTVTSSPRPPSASRPPC